MGKESEEFNAWGYLSGMASEAPSPANYGLSVLCLGAPVEFDGVSLLQTRLAAQDRNRERLLALKDACEDMSWQLHNDDVVYHKSDCTPSVVIRIGYGSYEGQA